MTENVFPLPNQIAIPPVDMIMPPANTYYDVIMLVMLFFLFIWTLYDWKKTGSPMMFLIVLGATLCYPQETIWDYVGSIWYAERGMTAAIRAFNVSIPLWVIPAYGVCLGGVGAWLYRRVHTVGLTVKHLYMVYLGFIVFNLAFEPIAITTNFGIYTYYGDQPLKFFGYPVAWVLATPTIFLLAVALLTGFKDFFTGWKMLLVPPLFIMCGAAGQAANGHPVWIAMNSDAGPFVKYFATFLSFFFSLLMVHLISLKLCISEAEYEKRKAGLKNQQEGA